MKSVKRSLKTGLLVLAAVLLTATPIRAETQDDLINKGITAYEKNPCGITDTPASIGTLPASILTAVNKNKGIYLQAAAKPDVNVPWQVLAAIHYRESSFRDDADIQAGNPYGGPYTQYTDAYSKYGYPKNLLESAIIAGKELQQKALSGIFKKKITASSPDSELIKDALFGYNGRAKVYADYATTLGYNSATQPYEGSPYVMNKYDSQRQNMPIITKDHGPVDGVDNRYGAYTLYVLLGGVNSGGGCGSGVVSGTFFELIKSYTSPKYSNTSFSMTDGYKKAVAQAQSEGIYVGGGASDGTYHAGIDCGGFVTILMHYSGVDTSYNDKKGNVVAQHKYVDEHPEKFQKVSGVTPTNLDTVLKPGDIFFESGDGHTYVYTGNIPGWQYTAASASIGPSSWRTPMSSRVYMNSGDSWYRPISVTGAIGG